MAFDEVFEAFEDFGRQGEDDGVGGVGGSGFDGLEGADGDTAVGQVLGGEFEFFRSGEFAFGGDDDGATTALGFSLFGHSTLHVGRKFDVLDFDGGNVNTPGVGFFINEVFNLGGEFVTFGE